MVGGGVGGGVGGLLRAAAPPLAELALAVERADLVVAAPVLIIVSGFTAANFSRILSFLSLVILLVRNSFVAFPKHLWEPTQRSASSGADKSTE